MTYYKIIIQKVVSEQTENSQRIFVFAGSNCQEEEKRGQPNYEHLEEDLHVLIAVEDTQERASVRLDKAVDEIKTLMKPVVTIIFFYFLWNSDSAQSIINMNHIQQYDVYQIKNI